MRTPKIRFTLRCLITVVVMQVADTRLAQAQKPYFPNLVFLPKNRDVNSIIDDVTSVHLEAMKEPSLWKLSRQDRQAQAYRFLWLASGEHPICMRLTRSAEGYVLHVAGHDGSPGVTAGRLSLNKDIKLTSAQGQRLVGLLTVAPFWASPVEVKESSGIADGDGIVVEGVKDGRYHVINRAGLAAGESLEAFCRSLLELADEPAMLQKWDRFRQEERKMPGYRPEPPQTENLGDPVPDVEDP